MASARSLSLQEQRRLTNTALSRKSLAPTNNAVSSIAKKSTTNEIQVMVGKYNDGLVGNQDMFDFLNRVKENPGLNTSDKEEINNKIRDYQSLIAKDNLESRYAQSPEGSAERVIIGQQLSNYYKSRASSLEAGTPAQSQALENSAVWQQKVTQDQQSIQKRANQIQRAKLEQQVNQYPSNSSENAAQKVQMYKQLYDQAMADGDEVSAQRYMASAQYESTRHDTLIEQEATQAKNEIMKASRKEVVDAMNELANAYHDGGIDENSYLQALSVIDPKINEMGDTALALTFNRTVDTVQKNLEKGGLRRTTTSSGLPAVVGKGPAGGQSTDWDQQDFDYNDNLRTIQEAVQSGQISSDQYIQNVQDVMSQRSTQLGERIGTLEKIASNDPNAKFTYEGKKQRASDLLDSLYKENDSLQNQYGAALSGKGSLFVVPPDQFNASGSIKKSGKSYATYSIIDPSTMTPEQQAQYAVDDTGVYHPVTRDKQFLNLQGLDPSKVDLQYQTITNDDGTQTKFFYDNAGNPYTYGGQKVSYYKPGSSTPETIPYEQGKVLSVRGLQPAVVQDQNGQTFKNPIAPENLDPKSVKATPLPPPQQLEQKIVPPENNPKTLNMSSSLPQGLTPISQVKQPDAKPVDIPNMTPASKPVNITPQTPGLTFQQPVPAPKATNLATAIQPVVQKVTSVLSQSPFDYLRKKLGF